MGAFSMGFNGFFSKCQKRYAWKATEILFKILAERVNVFSQDLGKMEGLFCFPAIPMISMFF